MTPLSRSRVPAGPGPSGATVQTAAVCRDQGSTPWASTVNTKRQKPRKPVLITKPVEAFVGPIEVRLMPYEKYQTAVDEYDARLWAWLAMCRVKLRIGGMTCTKKLTARYAYWHGLGVPREERPDDPELFEGLCSVVEQVKSKLERLGLESAVGPEVVVNDLTAQDVVA